MIKMIVIFFMKYVKGPLPWRSLDNYRSCQFYSPTLRHLEDERKHIIQTLNLLTRLYFCSSS